MKKLLLSIGSIAAVVTPIVAVVSCGNTEETKAAPKTAAAAAPAAPLSPLEKARQAAIAELRTERESDATTKDTPEVETAFNTAVTQLNTSSDEDLADDLMFLKQRLSEAVDKANLRMRQEREAAEAKAAAELKRVRDLYTEELRNLEGEVMANGRVFGSIIGNVLGATQPFKAQILASNDPHAMDDIIAKAKAAISAITAPVVATYKTTVIAEVNAEFEKLTHKTDDSVIAAKDVVIKAINAATSVGMIDGAKYPGIASMQAADAKLTTPAQTGGNAPVAGAGTGTSTAGANTATSGR